MIVAGMNLLPMILAVAGFAAANRPCGLNGFRRESHIVCAWGKDHLKMISFGCPQDTGFTLKDYSI